MHQHFQVGEIATFQNLVGNIEVLNGTDCEVVGGLERRHWVSLDDSEKGFDLSYVVRVPNDPELSEVVVLPHELRKKRPPSTGEDRIMELFKPAPVLVEVPA